MDYYLSRIAFVSVALFTLIFLAGFLSIGLISKHGMDAEAAKARDPDFNVPGMRLRNVALAIGVFAMAYLLYFGTIDGYFYGLVSVAVFPAILAMSRAMNAIGVYSFATVSDWHRIRRKAFLQAILVIAFVYALDYILKLMGLNGLG